MSSQVECFVAYPGEPRRVSEILQAGLRMIRIPEIEFHPWEEMRSGGRDLRYLILEEEIRKSNLFLCDLSGLNQNVLFELGFAIAIGKRIWSICAEDETALIDKFPLLRPVGYRPYRNSPQIQDHFFKDMPHANLTETLRRDILPNEELEPDESVLYIKSAKDTEESLRLSHSLEERLPLFTDDSQEAPNRSLDWYAEKAFRASAVILHLLRNDDAKNIHHNAKCSLIAGMARGFGKEVVMLAHDPFRTPIDYENLLQIHSTPSQCVEAVRPWIDARIANLAAFRNATKGSAERARRTNLLLSVSVGDYVAENEMNGLASYFVPTEHQQALQRGGNCLVVGRKGSGKTASLLMLETELKAESRNLVCPIRPINYDLEALISLLHDIQDRAERGNLLESVWKYLLTTEIARTLRADVLSKDPSAVSGEEGAFIKFAETNLELFSEDFSARLKSLVSLAAAIGEKAPLKLSETVHTGSMKTLRSHLSGLLDRKVRICFLIDNLDKAWAPQNQIHLMAEFIFALLGCVSRLARDLTSKPKLDAVSVVFLRSDIYSYMVDHAREPDKMPLREIGWSDEPLLMSVIEERLRVAAQFPNGEQVWRELFAESVDDVPVRTWLMRSIVPRPRDLIHLVAGALKKAVARAHSRIDASDLKNALVAYSEFAVASLIVEARTLGDWMEEVIYEFIGMPAILRRDDVLRVIEKVPGRTAETDEVISLLVQLSFLGYEGMIANEFRYEYGILDRKKLSVILRKQRELGRASRFCINHPFRKHLEIRNEL